MVATVEILVKIIEDSSDLKKVEKGLKGLDKTTNEAIVSANRLGKQWEQTVGSIEDASEGFLELNPELKLYRKLTREAAQGGKELGDSLEETSDKADKLGKSFGKQLKGMAKGLVGVATAYAAGRWLVDFAKDSLAAAKAGGTLPPIFSASEKASDRLALAVGERLGNALEGTTKLMTRMKNSTAANLEITNRMTEAEKKGILTAEELGQLRKAQALGMRSQVDVLGILTEAEERHTEALEAARMEVARFKDITFAGRAAGETERRAAFFEREIPVEIVPFFKDLDLNIGSQIQAAMDAIDFEEAGGKELVQGFREIFEGLDVGDIGPELADQIFAEMFIQAEQIKVAMGEITAHEAAKNIQDELGGTLQEQLNRVRDIEKTLRAIGGLKVRAQILIDLKTSGGVFPPGINLAEILGGQPVKKGRQHGGTVTGGSSFLVGEAGPELFVPGTSGNIVPNNRLGGGGDMSVLEGKFDKLSSDITNALLDVGQMMAERG